MRSVRNTALTAIAVLILCTALCTVFESASFSYAEEYSVDFDPAYGYGSLNENMQRLYDDIVNDIESMLSGGINITSPTSKYGAIEYKPLESMNYKCSDYGIDYPETCSVFSAVRLLHPEYYFLPGIILNVNSGERMKLTIVSEYATSAARDSADELIERAKAEILTGIDEMQSDYEKVLTLHDRIINAIDYAYDSVGAPENAHWAHSIIGAVTDKKEGVCETYAKWFSYLLLESDIENYIVTGVGHGQNHAWNIVRLDDGKWYNFDLTWDDNASCDEAGIYYGYFATPSSVFGQDHSRTPDEKYGIDYLYKTPTAENSYKYSYYSVQGAMPDCSDENAFFNAYSALWKKALEKGDRFIRIYVKNKTDLDFVLSKITDLSPVRTKLHEAGINDDISAGSVTIINNNLVAVHIDSSSYCPNAAKHSYTAKTVSDEYLKSAADCKNKAVYYYACVFCGKKGTVTYQYGDPTNDHRLTHTPATEPDCENAGNIEYWFCTVCGKYFSDIEATQVVSYNEIELGAKGHNYGNVKSDGEKEHIRVCERCGRAVKEAHSWDEGRVISAPGEDKVTEYICTVCGETRTETEPLVVHIHSYSETWSFDTTNHWRECSCGEKTDESAHSFEVTADDEEKTVYTCSVCGFVKTEEKCAHVHEYGKWQPYDDETHKRFCVDGDSEESAPHGWKLTGEESDGKVRTITYICPDCGETKTEKENGPPSPHTHVYEEWQPYDAGTHKRFCVDGDSEESAPHDFIVSSVNTEGLVRSVTYTCSVCGETFTETEELPDNTAKKAQLVVMIVISTLITVGVVDGVVIFIRLKKNKAQQT